MNAATPIPPAPVPPTGPVPSVDPNAPVSPPHHVKTAAELAAEEVRDNALYRGLNTSWSRLKQGNLVPSKFLAVLVLAAVAGGLWWWFSGQSRKAESHRWADFSGRTTSDQLQAFAAENPNTPAANIARRSRALNLLGPDGTDKLRSKDQVEWKKAVANVEAGRDELIAVAEAFKKDRVLQALCYRDAAVAERALIGVPKVGPPDNAPSNQRGTATRVAELYRQAAAAIGANTDAGAAFEKEAVEVEANARTILQTNSLLYSKANSLGFDNPPTPSQTVTPTPDPKK